LNPKEILQLQRMLFTSPDKAWISILQKQFSWKQVFFYYLIPLIFLSSMAVAFFTGPQLTQFNFSINQIFFMTFASTVIAILINGRIVSGLAPRFSGNGGFNEAVALISFGYSPVFIGSILSSAHPALQIINIISMAFMFYIYFKGTATLLHIPPHKQMGFTFISLMILFLSRLLILGLLLGILGISDSGINAGEVLNGR
jgi:hypothetical protein